MRKCRPARPRPFARANRARDVTGVDAAGCPVGFDRWLAAFTAILRTEAGVALDVEQNLLERLTRFGTERPQARNRW